MWSQHFFGYIKRSLKSFTALYTQKPVNKASKRGGAGGIPEAQTG